MSDARSSADADLRRPGPKSARELLQPDQVPPPPNRSRASRHPLVVFFNFFITIAVIAIVVVGGLALFAKVQFDGGGPLTEPRVIQIAEGTGVTDISERLQELGIISNRWIFRAGVAIYGAEGRLQAGEYLIPAGASMRDVMDRLVEGRVNVYSVTLPEGLTSQQIVARINADENLTGEITDVPAEGTLLPDTYQFSRGASRQSIIDRMVREHDRVVREIWDNRVAGLPIDTIEEFVTLASIVEKETGIADERSRVAAVFINRLNRGMRLQSDPTIIYGVYGGAGLPPGESIRQSQINQRTPYNTYQIDGLPPGPIANPGLAALQAVANPSRTNDLYFVADGTGGHVFAETLEDHNRNVARYREIERQREAAAAAAAAAAPAATPDPVAAPAGDPAATPGATPATPAPGMPFPIPRP